MRTPHRPHDSSRSPLSELVVALAVVGGFVGLLVALAHPVAVATAATVAVGSLTVARTAAAVRRREPICVPRTRVCLDSAAS